MDARRSHEELRRGSTGHDAQPAVAIWEMTRACDVPCLPTRACDRARRDPRELSTEEGRRLLSSVAAMGVRRVVLTGGDPAKRPDLVDLAAHGAGLGLGVVVAAPSSSLLSPDLLRRLRDADVARIALSFDGPDARSHDALRGSPGSFERTRAIARDAARLGIELEVDTTLTARNRHQLADLAAFVSESGAVAWTTFVVMPGSADRGHVLDAPALEDVLDQLAKLAAHVPFPVTTVDAPQFRRVLMERGARRASAPPLDERRGLTDGVGMVFVSHTGDIRASAALPLPAGNVREDELERVYASSPLFVRLRDADALGGKCGRCPYRRACGGSRARAYATTGDAFGADPGCLYEPRTTSPPGG